MGTLKELTKRNIKMFFKDKGMFFTSLITPIILLILYSTFLANVFRDSFASNLPDGFEISQSIIKGTVAGQLFSSLLSVSCITVAFCANLLMVQDKANGIKKDFLISPVKRSTLAISYYLATFITTLIINMVATLACFLYTFSQGWYLSFVDVILILLDVIILCMFGTAFSSFVNSFLSTNGQASAFGTIVSAGYGFICGAYMPISSFGKGLQNALSLLPGTYGTSLFHIHTLRGVCEEMIKQGVPVEIIDEIKRNLDCGVNFFGTRVGELGSYIIVACATILLILGFVLVTYLKSDTKMKKPRIK